LTFVEQALEFGAQAPFNCPIYQVPDILIFRPPAQKISNTEKVDYIGKAKVVAAALNEDTFAGFSGSELKRKGSVVVGSMTEQKPITSSNSAAKSNTNESLASSSAIMTLNRAASLRKDSIGRQSNNGGDRGRRNENTLSSTSSISSVAVTDKVTYTFGVN
jgi:hypothetical protein